MDYWVSLVVSIVFVGGLIFCFWEYLKGYRDMRRIERTRTHLMPIYKQIWGGDPADRETAWYRTIGYLERNGFPEETIREARIRMTMEGRRGQNSHYYVNSNGRIIGVDERGGDPEAV
jgi:hypothetical protein